MFMKEEAIWNTSSETLFDEQIDYEIILKMLKRLC